MFNKRVPYNHISKLNTSFASIVVFDHSPLNKICVVKFISTEDSNQLSQKTTRRQSEFPDTTVKAGNKGSLGGDVVDPGRVRGGV
jgi:hypothetical protein